MAVEPEEILHPFASGSVKVPRIVRHPNGDWSVEFEINFRVKIDDTRDVHVTDRHVMVRGTQRGRKAFTPALVSALAADETLVFQHKPDCPRENARLDGVDRWFMTECDCGATVSEEGSL